MDNKMVLYFSDKSLTGDVPVNVDSFVKKTFSHYEVELQKDRMVLIKVPKSELDLIDSFNSDVRKLLHVIHEKNDVLAEKLARQHGF